VSKHCRRHLTNRRGPTVLFGRSKVLVRAGHPDLITQELLGYLSVSGRVASGREVE
jgi:hypothetical protein